MTDANQETGPEDVSIDSLFFKSAPSEPTDEESNEAEALNTEDNEATEETPEESADTEQEAELFTVNPDGEEMHVSLDELKAGFMKTQTFKRKTTEASAAVKEANATKQEFAGKVDALQAMLSEEVDWFESEEAKDLKSYDKEEYWKRYESAKSKVEKFKALSEGRETVTADMSEDQIKEERDQLLVKIPEWTDTKKMQEEGALALKAAADAGFSNDELSKSTDHRFMVLARKAAMFDKIMSAKPERKAVKPKSKSAKPKSGGPSSTKSITELFYGKKSA